MTGKATRAHRNWINGNRIKVTEGHFKDHPDKTCVILLDHKTGNVTTLSVPAAYKLADQLVDLAEQLERKGQGC